MTELEKLEAEAERITTWISTLPAHNGARGLRESGQRMLERVDEKIQMLVISPPVNVLGPGEGPIAWPTDEKTVGSVAEIVARKTVTPGGPKAFFQPPQTFAPLRLPNENGYTPGDTQEQIQPFVMSNRDKEIATLKAEFERNVAAVEAKHSAPTPPAHQRTKIPANPKIGIVICTYGSVPYVHLGLEALRRNEPDVPVLVHDDCSLDLARLRELAQQYGAEVVSTVSRRVPTVGDLSGFVEGLRWSDRIGLDIVVKVSRRMILNKAWSADLGALMHNTGYATACAPETYFSWGYRSEACGLHVRSWIDSGAFAMMNEAVQANVPFHSLPEAFHHERARDVHKWLHPEDEAASYWTDRDNPDCDYTVRYEKTFPSDNNHAAYAQWLSVLGLTRVKKMPGVLWHDSHQCSEYADLAKEFGLSYSEQDYFTPPGS